MRHSLYWDNFSKRIQEAVEAINTNRPVKVRRVAIFITNRCNFHCSYCNHKATKEEMTKETFLNVLNKYGKNTIYHITGGEPSLVPWLYPLLDELKDEYQFHLNTNAYIEPPYKAVKRLKVSLDSHDYVYWNGLVGVSKAWDKVVSNIKKSIPYTTVSITYTLTKQNFRNVIEFIQFCNLNFKGLYAIFFSIYKGKDPRFVFTNEDVSEFFNLIVPRMYSNLDKESSNLLLESMDEKARLLQGVRFPQNIKNNVCYISMSERVISPEGRESQCSHLYRDGIYQTDSKKCDKCLYGCNRRLVSFNEEVEGLLNK